MNATLRNCDGEIRRARILQFRDLREHDIFMLLDDFFAVANAPVYVKVSDSLARRVGAPASGIRLAGWQVVMVPLADDACGGAPREYLSSTPISRMARERAT